MIPFIPQSTDTNSVTSKLSSLFDAESLIGLFTDTCDTKKDITNQIPLWVVFEKEELEDAGKTPISIFDLIQKYYDWLYCDAEGGSEYQLGLKLLDLIDIDKTREAYVGRLAGIYADGLSSSSLVPYGGKIEVDNARNFIHSVRKNFHQKKTTIDGIRYFFKTLFAIPQEDVKVELPKKYLLRLNGGRFYNEIFSFPGGTGSYDVLQTLSGSCLNFSRMQDGNFYQDYSYLLKVGIKSSYYKDTYKTLAHPAGLKVIYEKTLEDYSGSQTDYDLSEVCERTFIRNYAPYGFSYDYTNDQIDFTQGKAIYGLKPCTGCDGASYGTLASPTFAFPNWANSNITGYNFKDIPLSYFFDLCYDNTEITSPNTGLTCTECNVSFTTQFDTTFKYLINRYEPGWSAATETAGRSATLELLGISAAANPFTTGGAVMNAFQYIAHPGTSGASAGWFNPIIHPRTYATSVRTAYRPAERARNPKKANLKFINYNSSAAPDIYYDKAGPSNTFFGLGPNHRWKSMFDDPTRPNSKILSMNLQAGYDNGIERMWIWSPYGTLASPQSNGAYYPTNPAAIRAFPWMTRNYAGAEFRFDQYLMLSEKTTIKDLLLDPTTSRNVADGILVDGVGDIHLNKTYYGLTYPAGSQAVLDAGNIRGIGYTQDVSVGSPWIPYPNGITWTGGWFGSGLTLNFNERTMVMNDGTRFVKTPPRLVGDFYVTPNMPTEWWQSFGSNIQGLAYDAGRRIISDLDDISAVWSNRIEFTAYLGNMPYAYKEDFTIPLAMYKDPTIPENVTYTKWRLDAAVSQWKEKFKSPHDGFAHVFMEGALVPRTHHVYKGPGYTAWSNVLESGISYVESIPVSWLKDQYNYTRGSSGPNADKGVIMGSESFANYMFIDEFGLGVPQHATEQKRNPTDTKPRHWCLDDNIATDLYFSLYDMTIGQRKYGFTYADSIWKSGVCGTSELGEIICNETPLERAQILDGYPFFYNSFIELNAGVLRYKRISGTHFDDNGEIPWNYDRRFRLFYLYPTLLALNMSVLDFIHNGLAYFSLPYSTPQSGWYDRTLGLTYIRAMEDNVAPYDPTIYAARNSIWVASLAPTDPTIAPDVSGAENMGVVNTYDYVKPMVHVFDCAGDGGYENSTAQTFVDGDSGCLTRFPSIVSKLQEITPGKRMYYLTRYNQGPIYNEVADRFANGKQSPWADAAGITLTSDWNIVANALAESGATPDYITLDLEQTGEFFNSQYQGDGAVTPVSDHWTAQVFGITSDVKYNQVWKGATSFSSLTTDNGNYPFGITHIVNGAFHPQTDKNYLYWDRAVRAIGSALIKDTITFTTNGIWENASVSNYGDIIIHPGTTEEAYNHNGHPYMQETLSGDASSPELYGSWDFPDSYGVLTSDPTRIVRIDYDTTTPFPNTAWNNLLIMIHTLRTARRNTTGKLRPWISTKYWSGGGGGFLPQWNTSDESRKLYNEMIRHCCLTGIEAFLILNNFGESTDRTTAVNELNNLMIEVNNRLGGAISKTIDSSRIDFTKRVLISGAPTTNGTILWRVTPQTKDTTLVDSSGVILQMLDGGMWMTTDLYSKVIATTNTAGSIIISTERNTYHPVVSNTPFANRRSPLTPPQNYWNETPEASEFELLYTCMKGGITMGLNSLHFNKLFLYLYERGATGFEES